MNKFNPFRVIGIFAVLLGIGAATVPSSVDAQQGGVRIGIVDVQQVLRDAKAAKQVRPEVEAARKAFQAEVQAQDRQFREAAQKLVNERVVLSNEAFVEKRRELDERGRRTQLALRQRGQMLDAAINRTQQKILREVYEVTKVVAKSKDMDIILDRRFVFFPAKATDLTAVITEALDKRFPSVELVLDESSKSPGGTDTQKKN